MANNSNRVEIRLINARNLISMDSNGYSDPFVKVTLEGSRGKLKTSEKNYKSQVIKKTLNPEWNELCTFKIDSPETNFFTINVYDQDLIGKDFLGFTALTLNDLEYNVEKVQWYKLSNVLHGEIQIGVRAINFSTIKTNNNSPGYNPYQPVPLLAPQWVDSQNSQFSPVYQGDCKTQLTQLNVNAQELGFDISFNELKLDKKIGVGAYGEVWKGEWAGTPVAVKKILGDQITESDLQEFSKEIMLMSKLRHPNVVQFLGACIEPFLLLTEYMDLGCLFNVLVDDSIPIDWPLKHKIISDIAKGMLYLHTRTPPIVHRDVKSLNVLVNADWKCTIADFGLTKIKDKAMLQTKCGSPAWSAPEILRGESYNEKADVFSFGIVMWEVLTREHPYKGITPQQLIGLIGYQKPGLRPPIPNNCPSPDLIHLMVKCWDNDPNLRPDFTFVLDTLKTIHL